MGTPFRDLGPRGLFLSVWLVLLLTPLGAGAEIGFSGDQQVHIQADSIEYLKDQGLVMARGSVHIRQGNIDLFADQVRYDAHAQDLHATGHVVWQDGTQEVSAEELTYNLGTRKGKASKIRSLAPPWISYGQEVLLEDKKTVILHAVTTTCDYPEGYRHYSLVADKVTVFSQDYLVAENVVLYIGKVPVFFFPVFVRTVHELKTPFSFSTGATDYLGNYLLLTTNYLFSPVNYGALYTDYFIKRGFGIGLRHEIALNDLSVLSLYGYLVPENGPGGRLRWEGRARGLWAVSSGLYGRVEAGIPGDGFFSQDYSVARRDPSLVSTLRDYNISATWTRPQYTLGLLLRRQESADTQTRPGEVFTRMAEDLPLLNFTLFARPLFFREGPKYDMNAVFGSSYVRANGYTVNHLSGEAGLSQSVLLGPTQNFYTRLSLREAYQDRSDANQDNEGETTSLGENSTWVARWTWFLTSTVTHSLSRKVNGLRPTDPEDGLLAHQVSASLEASTGADLRFRTSLSYDLALKVTTDAQRFSFLRQEVYWIPSPLLNVSLVGDYSIKANALKDFNGAVNFQTPEGLFRARVWSNFVDPDVGVSGVTVTSSSSSFQVGEEVAFAFFEHYRISLLSTYNFSKDRFDTKSVSLYRDLHDWEAELNYAEDAVQGKRISFKLNLKAFTTRPLDVSEDQLQRLQGLRDQGLTGAASQFN